MEEELWDTETVLEIFILYKRVEWRKNFGNPNRKMFNKINVWGKLLVEQVIHEITTDGVAVSLL